MPLEVLRAAPLLDERRSLPQLRHERRHAIAIRSEQLGTRIDVRIENVHSGFGIRDSRISD
jgi:hypothetical protein